MGLDSLLFTGHNVRERSLPPEDCTAERERYFHTKGEGADGGRLPRERTMATKSTGGGSRSHPQTKRRKNSGAGYKSSRIRTRMNWLMAAMVAGYLVVIGALAWYQLINAEVWQQRATEQQLSDTENPADRGTIYDTNMNTVVQSTTAWVISLRPDDIEEAQTELIVKRLSEVLELDEEYIRGRMAIDSPSVKLKVKADKEQKDAIYDFCYDDEGHRVVKGIDMTADTRRTYSYGSLASTVLGFTGTDNTGLSGLEAKYDVELSGVPGRVVTIKNARADEMPFEYNTLVDPQEGNSLVLTIDANIQQIVEEKLVAAVEKNQVRNRACAIMMDVNTGAVLAMATVPDYDPANYTDIADPILAAEIEQIEDSKARSEALSKAQSAQWRNKAISDAYEPGSVFKPITMSAALEEGVTYLSDNFYCGGAMVVGGLRTSCHKSAGHGAESLTMGMVNSCNCVFMTLGDRLGGSGFFKYYKAFGFTEKTGIDLPGEASPVAGVNYHKEENLNRYAHDLAVVSFGQTNTVTPIQMITAICAVSNGGYLLQPYVVAQVLDSNGNIITNNETTVKRQVISAQTSAAINDMLEATVSKGTARNCYIAGYRIGGKTGTSEKIAEQAQTGQKTYVASFCAVAPSDDPEIALLVLLDDPRGASHMGGTIAAPVAREILEEVLPYLSIDTIYSADDVKNLDTVAPNLMGKPVDEVKAILKEKGLSVRVIGDGDTVTAQTPMAGQSIPKGGKVVVTTREEGEVPLTTVPKVTGLSPREANRVLADKHLNIRYAGSGYNTSQGEAVAQNIPGGSQVAEGTVITVEFIMKGSTD